MKRINIIFLLTILMCMVGAKAFAYDISVKNSDGVTIYYYINSDGKSLTVAPSDQYHSDLGPYNLYTGDIVIPDSVTYYNGKTYIVTSISSDVFKYSGVVTSVTIPNSVTSIGNGAFDNCRYITSITWNAKNYPSFSSSSESPFYNIRTQIKDFIIGDEVTSIPSYMCYGMSNIKFITIPNSVTSIGSYAFSYCSGLTSVTIHSSVTSIGNNAFYNCSGLQKVIVQNIKNWCSIEFGNYYANPLYYAHHLYSDENTEITKLVIPEDVTSIGSYAFYGCSSLTSMTIPNSVTSIGSSAFSGCNGLTSITWNAKNYPAFSSYSDNPFYYIRTKITEFIIGDDMTSIPKYMCYGMSNLKSVTIGNSVTNIGYQAFYGCSGLKSITWNAKNYPAFSNYSDNPLYNIRTQITEFIIGDEVTSIPKYMCYGMSNLKSVTIPNSVTSIGKDAFYGCSGLEKVIVPNFDIKNWCSIDFSSSSSGNPLSYAHHLYSDENTEITKLVIPDDVTSIGNYAFYNCSGLTSVTIPNSVTSIGSSAFQNCSGLTSVSIPNSVSSIGNFVFRGCSGLTSVSIPNSVTSIGSYAFSSCSGLTSITIPNSVTSIGSSAFYNCSGLTSVTIPNSVTSIGSSAFDGCSGLTSITWNAKNYPTFSNYSSNPFYDIRTQITEFIVGDEMTSIPKYMCYEMSNLESVTIGNSVTSIGSQAFYNTKIKSLTIGSGIQTIASDAFSYSSSANGATPVKVVWLANTPPSGYENVKGTVNYVANNQYTKLSNATVYPFLNSMFEVGGIKYVPVSPSERTCDAIDCMYDASAENINIGKTVSYKGVALDVKDIKPYACYMNNNIKSIDISNDGSIGQFAFSQAGMEKAIIKNNGGIGNSAFRSCLKLKTVELGQYITDIGSSAFQSCRMLESIEIPDNVKTLGTGAFSGCTSLKSAKTGNGISLLKTQTFSDCTSLENVEIGTNITKISGKSGTYSNYGCFYNCSSLEQIQVPGNVKEIEDYVFNGCTGLKNVIIDNAEAELKLGSNGSSPIFSSCPLDSVYIGRNISYPTASSYGYSPFYRNTSLRTVHITDKETEISENEFYGCTNLRNVRIGDGVTYIGNWAFSGCSSIEYFSFGSAMQSIGKEAFSDCTAITKLISHAMTPPVCDSQALDDISKWVCTLSVPKGTVSSYQQAAQWKEFFFIDEGATGIQRTVSNDSKSFRTYNINGYEQNGQQRGLNIIRMSDGTVKKVMVK